jgi:hypothetical protein
MLFQTQSVLISEHTLQQRSNVTIAATVAAVCRLQE